MGIKSIGDTGARRRLISPKSGLSLNEQLELLSISKRCYYYKPAEVDSETLKVMRLHHVSWEGSGQHEVFRQHSFPKPQPWFRIGERKVRRLMRQMNMHVSYPAPRFSTIGSASYVYPYLRGGWI